MEKSRQFYLAKIMRVRDETNQILLDQDHWNRLHPDEPMDVDFDGKLLGIVTALSHTLEREGINP